LECSRDIAAWVSQFLDPRKVHHYSIVVLQLEFAYNCNLILVLLIGKD